MNYAEALIKLKYFKLETIVPKMKKHHNFLLNDKRSAIQDASKNMSC